MKNKSNNVACITIIIVLSVLNIVLSILSICIITEFKPIEFLSTEVSSNKNNNEPPDKEFYQIQDYIELSGKVYNYVEVNNEYTEFAAYSCLPMGFSDESEMFSSVLNAADVDGNKVQYKISDFVKCYSITNEDGNLSWDYCSNEMFDYIEAADKGEYVFDIYYDDDMMIRTMVFYKYDF